MEPGTGLTVLGAALGSKDLVVKILGPTADYLGIGLRDWTERSANNLGRIFENARKKLGENVEKPGAVPPKVLKGILAEGQFCDDELSAEYFGGVLASSRTEVGRDDRGASFIALLGRLSSYQIRSHYFFYKVIRLLYQGSSENIGAMDSRNRMMTFVPMQAFQSAMDFGNGENLNLLLPHTLFGLHREALLGEQFYFGNSEQIRQYYPGANTPGITFLPSALGAELFLWAHGRNNVALADFTNPSLQPMSDIQIEIEDGIRSVTFPDRLLRPFEDKNKNDGPF